MDALAALIPAGATSIDDLPKFIGAGINIIPELVLNDEIIMKGSAMSIGREVQLGYKPILPNVRNNYPAMAYDIIAGSYLHIPVVGYSVNTFALIDTQENVAKTKKILEDKDPSQLAKLTREDILGDLFYTGGLGYYAQLHSMNTMLSQQGNGIGKSVLGYGSYGYEPKLKQAGILANPVGILPGSISTNLRAHNTNYKKDKSKSDNNIGFAMGMNGSLLESAISEQLFCNKEMNPNNEPCYGISTVSGLQMAASQGQKIYQINKDNREQLKNIQMSGDEMANDINTAINSGGYVIVPERAVDGAGRNAIYVYMTQNSNGNQAWKISGGLNGGTMNTEDGEALSILALSANLEIILSVISKWIDRLLNILNMFEAFTACGDTGKPEQLGPLLKFLGCWAGEYLLSMIVGAFLAAFIPVIGPVIVFAIIMSLITHFIVDLISGSSFDKCQLDAIRQCREM